MFSMIFVIVWLGSAVVTVNGVLIKGKVALRACGILLFLYQISFFQSVCVLGYCVFPLVLSAIVCYFVKNYQILKVSSSNLFTLHCYFYIVARGTSWIRLVYRSLSGVHVGAGPSGSSRSRSVKFLGCNFVSCYDILRFPVWLFYATIAWIILLI